MTVAGETEHDFHLSRIGKVTSRLVFDESIPEETRSRGDCGDSEKTTHGGTDPSD